MLTLGSINLGTAWSFRLATRPVCGLENSGPDHTPRPPLWPASAVLTTLHSPPRPCNTRLPRFHRGWLCSLMLEPWSEPSASASKKWHRGIMAWWHRGGAVCRTLLSAHEILSGIGISLRAPQTPRPRKFGVSILTMSAWNNSSFYQRSSGRVCARGEGAFDKSVRRMRFAGSLGGFFSENSERT